MFKATEKLVRISSNFGNSTGTALSCSTDADYPPPLQTNEVVAIKKIRIGKAKEASRLFRPLS